MGISHSLGSTCVPRFLGSIPCFTNSPSYSSARDLKHGKLWAGLGFATFFVVVSVAN